MQSNANWKKEDHELSSKGRNGYCQPGGAETEKDLGVWISKDLKWRQQCRKSASKAMSVLGMIKRCFRQLDIDSFKILYNTYIRPHLEYCVQVWNPTKKI